MIIPMVGTIRPQLRIPDDATHGLNPYFVLARAKLAARCAGWDHTQWASFLSDVGDLRDLWRNGTRLLDVCRQYFEVIR